MPSYVLKLGGSLINTSRKLMRALISLANEEDSSFLVVPGGGPFADLIREIEARKGLSEEAAHWMAVLAMEQYAFFLADGSGASLISQVRLPEKGGVNVLLPPLAEIYPLLEEKDFTMVTSLSELGFVPVNDGTEMCFQYGTTEIKVGRAEWNPSDENAKNYVSLFEPQESGGVLAVYYTPDTQTYDFKLDNLSGKKTGYSYNAGDGTYDFGNQSQQDVEELLTSILGEPENGDLLASPAANFNETIFAACGINADVLCALPKEFVTLTGLGFQNLIESDGVCTYRDENDPALTISVHHPEWNNIEWNVEYTFPVNGYSVRVWYYESEPRFFVRAKAADGTSADYEYRVAENQYNNGMAPEGMTSEDYFAGIYGDPVGWDWQLAAVHCIMIRGNTRPFSVIRVPPRKALWKMEASPGQIKRRSLAGWHALFISPAM